MQFQEYNNLKHNIGYVDVERRQWLNIKRLILDSLQSQLQSYITIPIAKISAFSAKLQIRLLGEKRFEWAQ